MTETSERGGLASPPLPVDKLSLLKLEPSPSKPHGHKSVFGVFAEQVLNGDNIRTVFRFPVNWEPSVAVKAGPPLIPIKDVWLGLLANDRLLHRWSPPLYEVFNDSILKIACENQGRLNGANRAYAREIPDGPPDLTAQNRESLGVIHKVGETMKSWQMTFLKIFSNLRRGTE